jgi:hypothetical protein
MRSEFSSRPTFPSSFVTPGIEFDLPYRAYVTLKRKEYDAGTHQVDLKAFPQASFYQLSVERDGVVFTDTKKIVLSL